MPHKPLPKAYRNTADRGSGAHVWRPPLYFSVLLACTLLTTLHEVLIRQAQAFARAASASSVPLHIILGCSAIAAGAIVARRWVRYSQEALAPMLVAAALSVALSAAINMATFSLSQQRWVSAMVSLCCGATLSAAGVCAFGALAAWWRQHALLFYLLKPHALLVSLMLLVLAVSVSPLLGLIRASLFAAGLLALLAWWHHQLCKYLGVIVPGRTSRWLTRSTGATMVGIGAAFVASESWVSRDQVGFFQSPIVLSARSPGSEVIITSGPSGLQVFRDRSLRYADIDGYRYFEALVHPALSLKPDTPEVLLIGSGDGFAAREVLQHDSVEQLLVVTDDLLPSQLARDVDWLVRRTDAALRSPKVQVVEQEPIVWLEQTQRRFEVIIVDAPDPTLPRWGKNFTRYFYRLVAQRLAPGGIAAIQAGPTFGATSSYASVESSIRSAGLAALGYQVPLPSIGDWGFFLASHAPPHVPSTLKVQHTRYLTSAVQAALFVIPKDATGKSTPPSTLYDQRIVSLFNMQRGHPE